MEDTEQGWGLYRLPDGSVQRTAEREAAAAVVATDLLLAAATKASEVLAAASLADLQRATARDLADRHRVIALQVVERHESTAELARQELARQEAAAAEDLALARASALQEVVSAELAAADALKEFESRLSTTGDVATARLLAAEELAAARQRTARTLADARKLADRQLAAAARLTASQVEAAEKVARAVQAKELASSQVQAAEELASSQVQAAEGLAAAHTNAAALLTAAALVAAQKLGDARDDGATELAAAAEQFRLVMDWAGVAACTVSAMGRFLRVNRAMCELLVRSPEELLASTLQEVTHPDDVEALTAQMSDLFAGQRGNFRTMCRYLTSDDRTVWGDLSISTVLNADGAVAFGIAQILDVTERMEHEADLLLMSTHDSLTGLANRAAMLDEADRALSAQGRSGRSTAVLVIDLDHFKSVNDQLGHTRGDEVLKAAAQRIESVIRGGDLAARPGGDEFVVVMRELEDPTDAIGAAGRLMEAFRLPFLVAGRELYTTASIGVTIATVAADGKPATDAGAMLREADAAMYAAKAAGRDRVSVYNEDLRALVSARLAVESDLRNALKLGQLAVWYQPEVDLRTGRVIAVEALLRWHHPDGTVWTADRFIHVAEDTGQILTIGAWVLRQACNQAAVWATARPDRPVTVRVNASALQLAEHGLLDEIDEILMSTGLDPTLLNIEITETALLRQTVTASENIAGINERGIGIAIDDFGTGYASLSYLLRYPINVLKIDRSFITDITTNRDNRAITAAIISLASALDMTITAEGVEHPDQAALLLEMGCPGAQGWLYSKAVLPDEVTLLLDHVYPPS